MNSPLKDDRRASTILILGTTQTLAWASSYYLPAMLAPAMARDLGIPTPHVFAAFSAALLISAMLGPWSGAAIDRYGGRPVLLATNVIFSIGLLGLGACVNTATLFGAWLVLGVGMGTGLYEAAFSTIVRLYGQSSRSAITGITLIAGFASTVGWPLSAALESEYGWRVACFTWAALHLTLGLGLNAMLPTVPRAGSKRDRPDETRSPIPAPSASWFATAVLAFVFAVTWFISTAMAAHLPRLLQEAGASLAAAVAFAALVGPSQVAARVLEFGFMRHFHPLRSAQLASLAHPIGAVGLLLIGAPAAAAFTILHGAGNGVLTIAKGTLPLVIFGPHGYGARQGFLMVPARIAQAFAPFLFGLCVDRWGVGALSVSAIVGALAFVALIALSSRTKLAPAQA